MSDEKTPAELFEEQSIGEKRIDAQCFLNRNFETIYKLVNGSTGASVSSWNNFRPVEGPPDKVIAKLASACDKKPINSSLTSAMLSSLVPKLKFYKVRSDKNNVLISETEIIFPDFLEDSDALFANKEGRGSGVGLTSFSFDYNGKNPAEVDSLIECEMKLTFNSMSDLFVERKGGFTFAELISKPKKMLTTGTTDVFNDKYYRIKVVIGYEVPDNEIWKSQEAKSMKKDLERFNRVFTLELVKHTLDFKDDGRVSLSIDFIAAADRVMSDVHTSSVFISFLKNAQRKKVLLEQEVKMEKPVKSKASQKQCKDPKKEKQKRERDFAHRPTVDEAYSRMTAQLVGSVKTVQMRVAQLYGTEVVDSRRNISGHFNYKSELDADEATMIRRRMNKALSEVEKAERDRALNSILNADDDSIKRFGFGEEGFWESGEKSFGMEVSRDMVTVRFLRFGDILDAALGVIKVNDADYKDTKFLIGSIPVRVDTGAGAFSTFNFNNYRLLPISEMFVSFDLYAEFILKNVILKEKRVYPLKSFIRDIFQNLIANLYSPRCFEGDADQNRTRESRCSDPGIVKPTFGMEIFTLEASNNSDPLGGTKNAKGGTPLNAATIPKKNYNENPDSRNLINYYYIYGKHPDSHQKLSKNEAEDSKRGIYHLAAAKETGFVKGIKFKKTDVKFQKEARLASEGQSGDALITERYNANVTMFGNNIFRPGMMIYINPDSFGIGSTNINRQANSVIKRTVGDALGIGGYYRVIKVLNRIESGKFETELECSWESNGSGTSTDRCKERGIDLPEC